MGLDSLLSTIILVSFLVTIFMAVGSYVAYKLREARRPQAEELPEGASLFFQRVLAQDIAASMRASQPAVTATRQPLQRHVVEQQGG